MSKLKKGILITSISFATLLLITMIFGYISVNYYSPDTYEVEVQPEALEYYRDTYFECRNAFVSGSLKLKERFDSVAVFKTPIESNADTGLYIDYCYVPGTGNPSRLLIISSGIHGVEGFAGSAVQMMFMDEFLDRELASEMGVLFIHGLNPYGFKHYRRFTENNVDLNRNWDIDRSLFATPNPGYFRFNQLINPEGKVDVESPGNRFFFVKALLKMVTNNVEFARQSILQGQYEYPDGLYFGGTDFEPQVLILRPLLEGICKDYRVIFHIDIHTGYGGWGTLHFFPNPVKDPWSRSTLEELFTSYHIDWGDAERFYTVTGEFPTFIGKINPGKLFLPMTFEFGTMNSQTTFGAIRSLQIIINENQGHHHGYAREEDKRETMEQFINMYYPQSDEWKTLVIVRSREAFGVLLPRYAALINY